MVKHDLMASVLFLKHRQQILDAHHKQGKLAATDVDLPALEAMITELIDPTEPDRLPSWAQVSEIQRSCDAV